LTLNEAKSKILLKSSLFAEESDLEALFSDTVDEIASQIEDEDFDVDYGFHSDWDDDQGEKVETEDIELAATKSLFDSLEDYAGHEENIERFCLPLFTRANSDYAVEHVIDCFKKRAAMSQIYASYLAGFLNTKEVRDFLVSLLNDESLVGWQRMWILAALSQAKKGDDACTKAAFSILKNGDCHEALRGVAAVYIGRFGEHHRRKALVQIYASVSPYIQSAIYFSSRTWPGVERSNAKASWGSQSPVNLLVTAALAKK
jgi:hypothetical protein